MAGDTGLDAQVPAWFICRQLQITKQTLNWWVTSGKLSPAGGRPGAPLYRYGDACEVERQTRRSGKSRRGVTMNRDPVGTPA